MIKFRAVLIPANPSKVEQTHASDLSTVEEWAAWKLAKNHTMAVQIFETREVLIGIITPDYTCGFCGHPAKSHLGDNEGKTKCTGSESCVCRRFHGGGVASVPPTMR